MFDIIIVGAGPIGLACSIEAKKRGLKSLILEKGVLVNSIYNYPNSCPATLLNCFLNSANPGFSRYNFIEISGLSLPLILQL